ncbi:hypothetical protein [Pseudoalteromonas rubra]|uniref:hypothetical protein n=1 Tax=Pseudoalteromonas rubra TaxID=43658 RepID=UPI002DB9C413|nr:hypothetical protein [Pseudoalteromonas rubra]MEC4090114.1 hypothetical protein [Pseudoalteromonas rubra]
MEKKKFTTREWVFVFIIASLVQGVVWYVSFVNAGNPSALTYVSFAGTLISIILAVLAIGYTYGESIGQKNKSDVIASQISVLNDVIKNIQIESESLEHISKISEELTKFSSSFEKEMAHTKKNIKIVTSSLETLLSESPNRTHVKPRETTLDKKELAQLMFSTRNSITEIVLFYLFRAKNSVYEDIDEILLPFSNDYIEPIVNKVEQEEYTLEQVQVALIGNAYTILQCLIGLQLVDFQKGKEFTITVELEASIMEIRQNPTRNKSRVFNLIKNKLLMEI